MRDVQAAPRRRRVSLGSALLRRGWILLVSMAVVAAAAYGVAGLKAATYSAEAVLNVSSALGAAQPGNAQQASELAQTYADAIPNDEKLQKLVQSTTGSRASGRINASPRTRSAVLRVTYSASSRSNAVQGANVIADALSADTRETSSITPGSLKVVRHASSATSTGGLYQATASLIVPSGAGPGSSVSADQAGKLATTYAGLIVEDQAIVRKVAKAVGQSQDDVKKNTSVVNEQNTSLLRVRFTADSPKTASTGAKTIAGLVSGPSPAAAGILPSSLETISTPKQGGTASKDKTGALPIGAVLGLALGLVLLIAWERSDPHVREARDLSGQLGCPATPVDRLSPDAARALLERWARLTDKVPAHVAILPANKQVEESSQEILQLLIEAGGRSVSYEDARNGGTPDGGGPARTNLTEVVLVNAAPLGGDTAGEAVALSCDLTVLVVPKGMKAADVRTLTESLGDFGIVPAWALLAPRRSSAVARKRAQTSAVPA
jgi:capsular polysaccharide biosynthesis protein